MATTSCSVNKKQKTDAPITTFAGIKNGALVYEGEITHESNTLLFNAFKKTENKPSRLIVTSLGGEIGAGLELGNWIIENELDIEVSKHCFSSCANYVFPAGRKKYLRKNSIIVWHGSAWQENWSKDAENTDFHTHYLPDVRKKETAFFHKLGIDNAITVYGHGKLTFMEKLSTYIGKSIIGWDYSLKDMARLGVRNIVLVDDKWNWRTHWVSDKKTVKRMVLSDDYVFKLKRFEL